MPTAKKLFLSFFYYIFLVQQRKKINKEEDLLGCETRSAFPQIQEITEAKEPFDKLWRALVTFHDKQEMWLAGPILKLNAEEIEGEVIKTLNFYISLKRPLLSCFEPHCKSEANFKVFIFEN